jgi:DedD protein
VDGLKQRVIGAAVLVSLAVIFVPMLFDEPHTERSSRVIELPDEPPFPEVQSPPADEPVVDEPPAYRIEEPARTDSSKSASPEAQGVAPEPDNLPAQSAETPVSPEPRDGETATGSPEAVAPVEPMETPEYAASLEGAWIVQLGSFGNTENARRLRDKVREQGYDSHIQRIERGGTRLTRVFSGPFVDKAAAEKAKEVLDAQFDVNSLVTSGGR